jgi:hypothetical protein
MVEPSPTSVDCPICGEAFDPTAAGGWCTNDECGEWKYEGEGAPEPAERDAEGSGGVEQEPLGEVTGSPPGRDESDDVAAGTPAGSGEQDPLGEVTGSPPGMDEPDREPDGEPDEADHSGNRVEDASAAVTEASAAADDAADEAETARDDVESAADAVEDELEAAAEEVGNAADAVEDELEAAAEGVDDAVEGEDEDDEHEVDEDDADEHEVDEDGADEHDHETGAAGVDARSAGASAGGVCPDCGDQVEPDDNFCASCGTELPASGPTVTLTECPNCGEAVDEDDSFCVSCGEDLDTHRAEAATGAAPGTERHPERLVLQARGRELTVEDGDAVGREFRRIVSETGGDEEEAVRIHREHVRFVREEGRFYLVDLGDNPTLVNGKTLGKGNRTAVEPGDTVTLSNVLTADVTAPSE